MGGPSAPTNTLLGEAGSGINNPLQTMPGAQLQSMSQYNLNQLQSQASIPVASQTLQNIQSAASPAQATPVNIQGALSQANNPLLKNLPTPAPSATPKGQGFEKFIGSLRGIANLATTAATLKQALSKPKMSSGRSFSFSRGGGSLPAAQGANMAPLGNVTISPTVQGSVDVALPQSSSLLDRIKTGR